MADSTPLNSVRTATFASPPRRHGAAAAFTIIETLVATVVVLIAMGAIFLVSSQCMSIIQRAHEVAVASAAVQERLQQLQAVPWETIADSDSFQDQTWTDPVDGTVEKADGLLKQATRSGIPLQASGAAETIRVSAYRPTATAAATPAPITATRSGSTVAVTSGATNLVDEKMVRIDVRLSWTNGRMRIPYSLGASALVARP